MSRAPVRVCCQLQVVILFLFFFWGGGVPSSPVYRITAHFIALTTTFFICIDDDSDLLISTEPSKITYKSTAFSQAIIFLLNPHPITTLLFFPNIMSMQLYPGQYNMVLGGFPANDPPTGVYFDNNTQTSKLPFLDL